MVDLTTIGDVVLRAEQNRRNREQLGYPYAPLLTDEDKLKWVKLRRDRLQRATDAFRLHEQERHARNESSSPSAWRLYQDTLLSMAAYMLDDLNFLLGLLPAPVPAITPDETEKYPDA